MRLLHDSPNLDPAIVTASSKHTLPSPVFSLAPSDAIDVTYTMCRANSSNRLESDASFGAILADLPHNHFAIAPSRGEQS